MEIVKREGAKRPRICAISYSSLSRLIHSCIDHYSANAEIRIIDTLFDESLKTAQDLVRAREVDAFISAGSNGAILRDIVSAPVVQVKVSGYDILRALMKAREISDRIAIVTYRTISPELEEVKQLLNLNVEQRSYTTVADAKDCFRHLKANGYNAIVGSSLITDLAEQAGLAGILLYSATSVRQALDDAIEICRISRVEEARRERVDAILHHLNEGVVAVDMQERIDSLNPAMQKSLDVSPEWAIGRRLSEVAPALSLEHTLRTGATELEQLRKIGNKTIVVNCMPIREHGVQIGAVLTSQDLSVIQRVDRDIRSRHRPRNLIAKYRFPQIVGCSPAIQKAKMFAGQYAKSDATVLITGESGTGKELFAQSIHNANHRRNRPFVPINCAAFPESLLESEFFGYEDGAFTGSRRGGKIGLIESAHTGTIFLDEVGDMPGALQTRLLRVLQEKEVLRLGGNDPIPVDVRVIASTNCVLRNNVSKGTFRGDLFYRLNILNLHLPALRERPQDIPLIADRLLETAMSRVGCRWPRSEVLETLLPYFQEYPWPGNVRELENVIERFAVFISGIPYAPDKLDEKYLISIVPELFSASCPSEDGQAGRRTLKSMQDTRELDHIHGIINECNGDRVAAAKRLGISRTTLWRKLSGKRRPGDVTGRSSGR